MKIAISNYDEPRNPYYSGGGARAMHELGKRFAKNHSVTIYCGSFPGCEDRIEDGIEYIHIGKQVNSPTVSQLLYSLALPKYVKQAIYDVWMESFVPPHSTNMLQKYTKKPVVAVTSLLHASRFSKKYHLPFHLVESYGLRTYNHVIALTKNMKETVQQVNHNADITVIPNGVEDKLFRVTRKSKPYVLFLGRIDVYQKGLDMLCNAWKIVAARNPGIRLVIAGDGTHSDIHKLSEIVRRNDLQDSIDLVGSVSGKRKHDLLASCLFAVSPSRFESFGMAALEVLAVGKALVCFSIPGYSWIPEDVSVKVKQHTVPALATTLQSLMSSRSKTRREQLGKKARKFAEKFHWNAIAEEYEKVFTKATNSPAVSITQSKIRPSISIGIPAYNEEENIHELLTSLLHQKENSIRIKEILVVSDGSTDATVEKIKSVRDKRIRILDRKKRLGMNATQNEIVKNVSGDILVLLNADVLPVEETMIERLVEPILHNDSVGIVGGNTASVRPHSFVEWIIAAGHELKQSLYTQLQDRKSVYLCHGRVRALKKDLYRLIRWPAHCPEDAYSYLFAKSKGYTFAFAPLASVYFRSPATLLDHAMQSRRFLAGQNKLKEYFSKDQVDESFAIPFRTFIKTILWYGMKHPVSTALYFIVSVWVRTVYRASSVRLNRWQISTSSKKVTL